MQYADNVMQTLNRMMLKMLTGIPNKTCRQASYTTVSMMMTELFQRCDRVKHNQMYQRGHFVIDGRSQDVNQCPITHTGT